jgi:tetratricopeptide (TPR) repeat protein
MYDLIGKRSFSVLSLSLFSVFLLFRLAPAYKINHLYLFLLPQLVIVYSWEEYATLGLNEQSKFDKTEEQIVQSLAAFMHDTQNETVLNITTQPPTSLLLLSDFNSWRRHREALSMYFQMLEFVRQEQDDLAISELMANQASGVLLGIGRSFNQIDELDRAAIYLEAALMLRPTSYPIIRELVGLYLAQKQYCSLLQIARVGADRYDSGLYYYYLGRAYEGLEDWELAAQAYQEALHRHQDYAPYQRLLDRTMRQIIAADFDTEVRDYCE